MLGHIEHAEARARFVLAYWRRSLFKDGPRTYRGVRVIYLPSIETKVLGTPTHTLLCTLDMLFRKVTWRWRNRSSPLAQPPSLWLYRHGAREKTPSRL